MIKIAFIGSITKEWMGGLNYFKNLLYALDTFQKNNLKLFVFVGKNTDSEIKDMFKQYAIVIEDKMFDKKSLKWYFSKIEQKILHTNFLLSILLKTYDIDVLSHSMITNLSGIKTLNWIPDFQHLHLKDMFSTLEIQRRNETFMNMIKNSDAIVLSSYDALRDFKIFAPNYQYKAEVLQFVSQPEKKYFNLTGKDHINLINKYKIEENFFYIPNQFWKHKNHMLVFQAISELKNDGFEIYLVCSGYMNDYRNKEYMEELKLFITNNNLEENIKFLGLIDYEDVFALMKFSIAVINPSLFEGWSSTVEECKSVGKNMILSNIDVHKEQYPEATFFEKNNVEDLKKVLIGYMVIEVNQETNLQDRTQEFANRYRRIIESIVNVK